MVPSFKAYLQECIEGVPAHQWDPSYIQLLNAEQRTEINFLLADLTDGLLPNPTVAYMNVSDLLNESCGLELPPVSTHADTFADTDGEIILPLVCPLAITQGCVYLYFAFAENDDQLTYDVLAEIVTTDELGEILDAEDVESV